VGWLGRKRYIVGGMAERGPAKCIVCDHVVRRIIATNVELLAPKNPRMGSQHQHQPRLLAASVRAPMVPELP
jgi:hypothetical protein